MGKFKMFVSDSAKQEETVANRVLLFEHEKYKPIPGSVNSYRTDAGKTTTKTIRHSHIYAKPKGRGKKLYAVNIDGSGHDGSKGRSIPSTHADYFRSLGYSINANNILETLLLHDTNMTDFALILMENG